MTASAVVEGSTTVTTSYTYDAAGRKRTVTAPPANPGATDQSGQSTVTTYSYDQLGNVTDTAVTNAAVAGNVDETQQQYDRLGHPTGKTEQAGTAQAQTVSFAYDAAGGSRARPTRPARRGWTATRSGGRRPSGTPTTRRTRRPTTRRGTR